MVRDHSYLSCFPLDDYRNTSGGNYWAHGKAGINSTPNTQDPKGLEDLWGLKRNPMVLTSHEPKNEPQ